jgi:ribonucleoside-diphosphate reductase alpha chain
VIEKIIKRNGDVEEFSPRKLNGWGEWASKALGGYVDWSEVVLHVASTSNSVITSTDLQNQFIDYCLTKRSFAYNRMAGRLYISKIYKDLYKEKMPTVKDLFSSLVDRKLMSLDFFKSYSDEEYTRIEALIDHSFDLGYTHYQIEQAMEKYSLQDRVTGEYLESPQYSMIRVAMQACKNRKGDRVKRIERHYVQYRSDVLNIPTPYYTNSGTDRLGLASCCVHNTDDDVGSLSAHNHVSYTMTVNSAGQGNKIRTRTVDDPVRGGTIPHQGKKPYYRAEVAMINANLQNGRGGAETQSFDVIDPEVEEILLLKNPMTAPARQIRGLDYAMCFNKFFASKAAKNEDWALFSYYETKDLYDALSLTDDTFEKLYNKYLSEGKARKIVKARDLLRTSLKEGVGVGRIYQTNLYEANYHTPFKSLILLSNLCQEVLLPTSSYSRVDELYYAEKLNDITLSDEVREYIKTLNDSVTGEVAVCSLAGINVGKFKSKVGTPEWDAEYREAAFVALDLIYTAIQDSDYPLPHIGYTAKKRMSAGVGIVDLAHLLAKYKLNYDSQEGRDLIHKVAESHYWHLLNASLEMSKEFGNAEWMDKTKWVDGWLPLDTYNKHVDEVVTVGLQYDWEGLRSKIIENGGHAFSVLVAHMPAESSSIRSGSTNGVYPIRDLDLNKTNDTNTVKYVVPESDKLGKYYQNAYDISVRDMAKVYGILQKWCDQGISADQWFKAQGSDKIKSSELMDGWFSWVYYGVKTRYYINTLTAKGVEMNVEIATKDDVEFQPEANSDCEECRL